LGQGVVRSAADPRVGLERITAAVFGFDKRVMKVTAHGVERR
jgi:hypothetical protein